MDENKSIINAINKLDYDSKKEIYINSYSLGILGIPELNNKLILISLLSLMYFRLKQKNPDITPYKILLQITKTKKKDDIYQEFLESLSIIVEDFVEGCKEIDNCGFKTSQEIINKIKEILNTWTPF